MEINEKIGNWKIISKEYKKKDINWVDCECSCGTKKSVRVWHLKNNKSNSCGCLNLKGRFASKCSGDLSSSYYSRIKHRCVLKNIYFSEEITIEYLWNLFLEQKGFCSISGIKIFLNPKWSKEQKGFKTEITQTASLDRINSYKGYEVGNVQWVYKDINMMKGCISQNDFIAFCKKVSEHNKDFNHKIKTDGKTKFYKNKRKNE